MSAEPHLPDPSSDLLLRYLSEDLLQEAATTIQFDADPSNRQPERRSGPHRSQFGVKC